MIGFKEPEVLFHTAALGHTGALGTELDWDGGLGHGVCIHMTYQDLWLHECLKTQGVLSNAYNIKIPRSQRKLQRFILKTN